MSDTTNTKTIPAGPADDRQRAFLNNLIDRTEQMTKTLNESISLAQHELSALSEGSITEGARGTTIVRLGAEALALRAETATMARLHRGYGLTAEQAAYAIHLGATQNSLTDDGAAMWLHGDAPANA